MIKILKKLKMYFPLIWQLLENINGTIIWVLWSKILKVAANNTVSSFKIKGFNCSEATKAEANNIFKFLQELSPSDLEYFKPFEFSRKSIQHILNCKTYQIFIVRMGNKIIGLYFIRYFFNKICFLGLVVNSAYRGLGLGKMMISSIVFATKIARFRLYSTVSENNVKSLRAHFSAAPFIINKKLSSGDLLLKLQK